MESPVLINEIVTNENLVDDLLKIYLKVFPDANGHELRFENLTGGYINSIFKITSKYRVVVFRTFDLQLNCDEFFNQLKYDYDEKSRNESKEKVDSIFNRETEFEIMKKLSKHGICRKGNHLINSK